MVSCSADGRLACSGQSDMAERNSPDGKAARNCSDGRVEHSLSGDKAGQNCSGNMAGRSSSGSKAARSWLCSRDCSSSFRRSAAGKSSGRSTASSMLDSKSVVGRSDHNAAWSGNRLVAASLGSTAVSWDSRSVVDSPDSTVAAHSNLNTIRNTNVASSSWSCSCHTMLNGGCCSSNRCDIHCF